jgi:hypothetical protein
MICAFGTHRLEWIERIRTDLIDHTGNEAIFPRPVVRKRRVLQSIDGPGQTP